MSLIADAMKKKSLSTRIYTTWNDIFIKLLCKWNKWANKKKEKRYENELLAFVLPMAKYKLLQWIANKTTTKIH